MFSRNWKLSSNTGINVYQIYIKTKRKRRKSKTSKNKKRKANMNNRI